MWRKVAFSHGELFSQMDTEEKEVMKVTFQNTVKNSKIEKVNEAYLRKSKTKKSVSFSLENNSTVIIPYYQKD
jgi:hypothetical protein